MTGTSATTADHELVAVVCLQDRVEAELRTIASLRRSHPELTILVTCTDDGRHDVLAGAGAVPVTGHLSSTVNRAWDGGRHHVLVVTADTAFPARAIDPALAIVDHDLRTATVSFLGGDSGFLSIRSQLAPALPDGSDELDEEAATSRLRSVSPTLGPAPIPFAAGPTVLLSAHGLSAAGPLPVVDGRAALALALFSLRARRRGFLDVVDPSTLLRRLPGGGAVEDASAGEVNGQGADGCRADDVLSLLRSTSWSAEADDLVRALTSTTSALAVVHGVARAKVSGLSVLIDGSCLGPLEMGTQVQTVALICALARRPDVRRVAVALSGPVPRYAQALLTDPRVDARPAPGGDLSRFGQVDVAHQPFQPEGPIDIVACGEIAARTVVTMLDVIAYQGRSYQTSYDSWATYRDRLRRTASLVDGVIAPSYDVERQIHLERLPVDGDRVFVVPIGTDHLQHQAAEARPSGLPPGSSGTEPFMVVLGADYTHKNRDLAIRALHELRSRGHPLSLVLAGAEVHGSSKHDEAAATTEGDPVFVLRNVTSEERNWLLRHASVVLYPTSAEGFGLVPFEAAHFGTPTVLVPFGPLGETFGGLPVTAADWSPNSLADAAEACLTDPATADAQVREALSVGAGYGWDGAAAALLDVYRTLLARPPVGAAWELAESRRQLETLRIENDRLRDVNDRMRGSSARRLVARLRAVRGELGN